MTRLQVSPALRRYFWRFGVAMTLYLLVLPVTVVLVRRGMATGPLLYALAVLPALPILGVFAALARYVAEEGDEYLRARMVRQMLYATGMMLMVATPWNFLSNFAGVPPMQWVGVVWLACFAAAAAVLAIEGR